MIYRIDIQHYLTHAIDYFTRDELSGLEYLIVSAAIKNGAKCKNVAKYNDLYPTVEIVTAYADEYTGNKEILEKMYFEMLEPKNKSNKNHVTWAASVFYDTFVNPLLQHKDLVIICDRNENDYIDALCSYLKKKFSIEVVDLNELFSKGKIGPIYIDRDEIWDKAVDIRRAAGNDLMAGLSETRDGKMKLVGMFTKKEKIAKLEELGIKVGKKDMKDIDKLLIEEWVENDNDEDEEE